jgi:hypothetical protein
MKKIHKKIHAIRVARVKQCASQLKGFALSIKHPCGFDTEQIKALNGFYTTTAVSPLRAKSITLAMKPSKLFRLFRELINENYNEYEICGFFYNEKRTLVVNAAGNGGSYVDFDDGLQHMYQTHPAFVKETHCISEQISTDDFILI